VRGGQSTSEIPPWGRFVKVFTNPFTNVYEWNRKSLTLDEVDS